MTLHRHHQPFHPAIAFLVQRAYRHGYKSGRRAPRAEIDRARKRWLKRHADEPIVTRVSDWEDGYHDGQDLGAWNEEWTNVGWISDDAFKREPRAGDDLPAWGDSVIHAQKDLHFEVFWKYDPVTGMIASTTAGPAALVAWDFSRITAHWYLNGDSDDDELG